VITVATEGTSTEKPADSFKLEDMFGEISSDDEVNVDDDSEPDDKVGKVTKVVAVAL